MNLATDYHALTTAAGAVFTGIGEHDTVPESRSQDRFSLPDNERLAAATYFDFELLHDDPFIVAGYCISSRPPNHSLMQNT